MNGFFFAGGENGERECEESKDVRIRACDCVGRGQGREWQKRRGALVEEEEK